MRQATPPPRPVSTVPKSVITPCEVECRPLPHRHRDSRRQHPGKTGSAPARDDGGRIRALELHSGFIDLDSAESQATADEWPERTELPQVQVRGKHRGHRGQIGAHGARPAQCPVLEEVGTTVEREVRAVLNGSLHSQPGRGDIADACLDTGHRPEIAGRAEGFAIGAGSASVDGGRLGARAVPVHEPRVPRPVETEARPDIELPRVRRRRVLVGLRWPRNHHERDDRRYRRGPCRSVSSTGASGASSASFSGTSTPRSQQDSSDARCGVRSRVKGWKEGNET